MDKSLWESLLDDINALKEKDEPSADDAPKIQSLLRQVNELSGAATPKSPPEGRIRVEANKPKPLSGDIQAQLPSLLEAMEVEPPDAAEQDYRITPEQEALADAGRVKAFWLSRQASGDPIADIALKSIDPPGGIIDYLFGGAFINNRLQEFSRKYRGKEIDLDEVRLAIMKAHMEAVKADDKRVPSLLSPSQITDYHHRVFKELGLPPTTFGGTRFTGKPGEADWTRPFWCGRCDR